MRDAGPLNIFCARPPMLALQFLSLAALTQPGAGQSNGEMGSSQPLLSATDPGWYPFEVDEEEERYTCLVDACPDAFENCLEQSDCRVVMEAYSEDGNACYVSLEDLCQRSLPGVEVCPSAAMALWQCQHAYCLGEWKDDKVPVSRAPGYITANERDQIRQLKARIDADVDPTFRDFGTGSDGSQVRGHNCTYLNMDFVDTFPDLYARLEELAVAADNENGWGLAGRFRMYLRVVEFLDYRIGEARKTKRKRRQEKDGRKGVEDGNESDGTGNIAPENSFGSNATLGLGWHLDSGSLVTLVAMLSDSSEYEGGILQTERNCTVSSHPMERGDVHIYRSLQRHRVLPITKGIRQVLVVEWWPHMAFDTRGRLDFEDLSKEDKVKALVDSHDAEN